MRNFVQIIVLAAFLRSVPARADIEVKPVRTYYADTVSTGAVGSRSGVGTSHGGVMLTDGTRIMLPRQTDPRENGLYIARSGAWERMWPSAAGPALVHVLRGTANQSCYSPAWTGGANDASTWTCR